MRADDNLTGFYEERAAEKHPTSDNPEMLRLVDRIAAWTRVRDGQAVLDFGCYDGFIVGRLARRFAVRGVGVDLSSSALDLAAESQRGTGCHFVCSDGLGLPFDSATFDVVVCSEILEHVPDLDGVLSEIARVLKPGGRLYATMPNDLADVWPPLRPICRRVDQVEGHLRRCTMDAFIAALERHGLRVDQRQYRGFAASAIWYKFLIYSPRVKERGLAVVEGEPSPLTKVAKSAAYAGMRSYLWFDGLFSRNRRCMGIDVAACRT